MLNFASQELNEWRESNNYFESNATFSKHKSHDKNEQVKLFADKLRVPVQGTYIERPHLTLHLKKSLEQFAATLLTGRAGTGKTTLAADFARQSDFNVAWYKVDNADSDWNVFASYLAGSLNQINEKFVFDNNHINKMEVAVAAELLAEKFAVAAEEKPLLIILDDLHSVFDADWFTEFFTLFLPSHKSNVHLLMTARAAPPLPLWRLRSKQVLGIMDEKLLAFTMEETIKLFRKQKLSLRAARAAHNRAYGRIAKLVEIAGRKK